MDQIEAPWSPQEDEMLENLFWKHGRNWSLISNSIPGRSDKSCRLRWLHHYFLFTLEEDEMLQNLVEKYGFNWSLISMSIPGRSDKSCRLRWYLLQRSFTPEEDEMLQNLVEKHGPSWSLISKSIPGRSARLCELRWLSLQSSFTLEEDQMLVNLVKEHGRNWSLISNSIPDRSAKSCELRWFTYHRPLFVPEEKDTNEDITINDHNIFIQPPCVSDINGGQRNSYIPDLTLRLAPGGISDQAPSTDDMDMETGPQNSIHQWNSSHEVGGMVSGHQPPSISDMARGNMSSGGTYSYSRDRSAPSWNALYIRDSSPMMTDSESVQQFVGSEFGRNDFLEVSSRSIVQGKGW